MYIIDLFREHNILKSLLSDNSNSVLDTAKVTEMIDVSEYWTKNDNVWKLRLRELCQSCLGYAEREKRIFGRCTQRPYPLVTHNSLLTTHQCAIIKRKVLSSQSKGDSLRDERPFIGKVKAILQTHDSLPATHCQNSPSPIDYSIVFP